MIQFPFPHDPFHEKRLDRERVTKNVICEITQFGVLKRKIHYLCPNNSNAAAMDGSVSK